MLWLTLSRILLRRSIQEIQDLNRRLRWKILEMQLWFFEKKAQWMMKRLKRRVSANLMIIETALQRHNVSSAT